ncbi:MAG: UvrD-helicase domain-containing protein [Clostridia bacterium]|nr:UvrD-helicase domain-containing protein [Clostridia bacterium]
MNQLENRYLKAKRALFIKAYSQKLNPEQSRAVFTTEGPLLVLAGAGSGKTTVLVNRIAFIIKYGDAYFSDAVPDFTTEADVLALENAINMTPSEISQILPEFIHRPCPPWQVLAITFTNKAAREIKERLSRTFDDATVTDAIWAGTFHSVCMRILRKYGERLGYRDGFSIYDTDDQKRLITICMKELSIDEKRLAPKAVANAISRAKDRLITPDEFEITHDPRTRDILKVYKLYEKKLMEYNAVDFDDIIMKTVELLTCDAEVREYYQSKFKYVLVDEYQDTNHAQFVLTELLSGKHRNIMVVGDDDQSIYRFRGATVENILNFDKTYPDSTVIKLEQNYRSTENILNAANAVIGHNDDRHAKRLWCDKGEGEKIVLREAYDQHDEGRYIIDKINRAVSNEGRKYSDFAILYRVNELARSLETSFTKSGVPYRVLGATRFYDRKEIKDVVAYLSVVSSPFDNLRLKRIINEPKRKIGAATVEAVEEIANLEGTSMYSVLSRAYEYTALAKSADKLSDFVRMIEKIKSEHTLPSEIMSALFTETGYEAMLKAEGFEGEGKIDNVKEFISAAIEYEKRCEEVDALPTLSGFLEEISLISDVDKYDEGADAVVLMTIHAAKGLEFPVVFLAGMEDGIFPSQQNMADPAEMSEERRLAYVAITRAKEKLYITYAKNRTMYGRTNYGILSSFVREEIPTTLIMRDMPRREPPRSAATNHYTRPTPPTYRREYLSELNRPSEILRPTVQKSKASSFGVEQLPVGTRVNHTAFGDGEILNAKEMGGDVLYEVKFDTGVTKRLMATFAKLRKI